MYQIIDVLLRVAREVGSTPARVALAWVQGQPGVTSTIIGARTMQQLDDNLGALDVILQPEHLTALHAVSRPTLSFPADFLVNVANFAYGGTTINGRSSVVLPLLPQSDDERY
jgi:diketogulonate reductase-like aldo/keto reductase